VVIDFRVCNIFNSITSYNNMIFKLWGLARHLHYHSSVTTFRFGGPFGCCFLGWRRVGGHDFDADVSADHSQSDAQHDQSADGVGLSTLFFLIPGSVVCTEPSSRQLSQRQGQ